MERLGMVALLFGLAAAMAAGATAEEARGITGRWLSGQGDGVIEIYECGASGLCGKLVWLKEPLENGVPAVDSRNPDASRRKQPICGLIMLGGFHQAGPNHWEDGWIYDPSSGKTYHATMTLESPTILQLRGYVGIPLFGETQTWTRADPKLSSC